MINVQNFKKQTPLHIAILNNNENAVQQLLSAGKDQFSLTSNRSFLCFKGADSSLTDNDGNTPLHLSVILMSKMNQSNILHALVSHQPNTLCEKNQKGLIPLHIAIKNFDYQSIGYLMPENDGKLNEYAEKSLLILDLHQRHSLHYAANSGLITFIDKSFKQMNKEIINQPDAFGLTPLHYAWYFIVFLFVCLDILSHFLFSIKWNGLDAIDILLRLGADVNQKCLNYEAIPLHYLLVYCYSSDTIE